MPNIVQKCHITDELFTVNEWEQELIAKFGVSLPTLCIAERHRRRLAQRNERSLYRVQCTLSGRDTISLYSPDKKLTVYAADAWWGDGWDAREYGQPYDFSRPFFEQFNELRRRVPRLALQNIRAENSDYCNNTQGNKNCYLVFGGDFNEDCRYSVYSMHCRDCSDLYWVVSSELAYDSIDCDTCYQVRYCQEAHQCRDSAFLFDCRNCSDCIACVGLRDKQYHIFNQSFPREEYLRRREAFSLHAWSGVELLRREFDSFRLTLPHRASQIVNSEHCSGDHISGAKNCENCFDIKGPAEDLKDIILGGLQANDLLSSDHVAEKAELVYETMSSVESYGVALSCYAWGCRDVMYSDLVQTCHDLFGCVGMKRAEYCILNTQYSRTEFNELRKRITAHMCSTGEWGEFFPMSHSLWGYNETIAQDLFPLSEKEARLQGLPWHTEEQEDLHVESSPSMPDSIFDVSDEILKRVLTCKESRRPYKIIPQELKFHRELGIPLPRMAPESRNQTRLRRRNGYQVWERSCNSCTAPMLTTYAPQKAEKVVCEACYVQATYGSAQT